ncbi:MAG: FG-GAP repeat protein, partial [Euryarchaeota archaeon]|nr:FG-GAP repeat protein [Euryarchaeota archaeon]
DMCFKTYFRKPLDISSVPQTVPSTPLAGMKMIDTSVTAVESLKNNAINATVPNISQASMGSVWAEEQKLLAVDGAAGDDFGIYASLDGDTALVGACADDDNGVDSGSAYVFTRTGTTWTQQAKLLPSDGAAGDLFGGAVSLSGDTALIGADQDSDNGNWSGSAYVFTRTGTVWTQQAKLLAPDGATEDLFGWWVSLDSNTALIAAKWDDDNGDKSGSAYVFTRTGTTWTLQQKLIGSDTAAGDRFGVDVCLDGDTAIIAAGYDDDNGVESGSAYVFTRTGTTWAQQAKLLASDGAAGDSFGGDTGTTSIDGDTAIIGAWLDHDNGADSGSAYVFTRTGSTWTQQQKLLASDGAAGDSFGVATALDGDTAIIAACYDDDNGANSGSAYVFTRTGTTWTQLQKLLAPDGAAGDQFIICSLDGNTALMSAWQDDDNGANSGSAYVFTKTAGLTYSITGGLGVNLKITNTGTINVSGVPWLIHVEGGILGRINKTVNGTIDIPVGESKTVGTGMLFGFGAISITAKVADEEQTATGTQIIIFSMVKK